MATNAANAMPSSTATKRRPAGQARKTGARRPPDVSPLDALDRLRRTGTPGYTLMYEIDTTCAMISRGRKKVRFEGTRAWTDNTHIVLPEITATALYDSTACLVLRGYGNHEAGHCRYTDWGALAAGLKAAEALEADPVAAKRIKNLYKAVSNYVEDSFLERTEREEFPGSRRNLDATRRHVVERGVEERIAQTPGLRPVAAFYGALFDTCNIVNSWTSQPTSLRTFAELAKHHPAIAKLVEAYGPKIYALRDSKESHRLSLDIVKDFIALLSQDPPEEEKEGGDDQGEEEGEGDGQGQGKGKGRGKGKGGEQDDAGGEDQASDGSERDDDAANGDQDDQDDRGGEDGQQDPSETGGDDADAADRANADGEQDGEGGEGGEGGEDGDGAGGEDGESTDDGDADQDAAATLADKLGEELDDEPDDVLDIDDVIAEIAKESAEAAKAIAKAFGQQAAATSIEGVTVHRHKGVPGTAKMPSDPRVARAIRSLVIASARKRVCRNRDDGEFDGMNIMSQALGTGDFYKTTVSQRQVSTALLYLVDQSGSMSSHMADVGEMVSAAAEASFGLPRLSTAVVSYTSEGAYNGAMLGLHLIKGFGDAPAAARASLREWTAGMGTLGGTPTAEGLQQAGRMLDARKEERKVVILITDGIPDNLEATLATQHLLRRRGIAVCLIEIGNHAAINMKFDVSAIARTKKELPDALETIAKAAIKAPGRSPIP